MSDRFRDLERPLTGRPKDIVLMATVTGFQSLRHPSKSDLHQFAQLFEPLYLGSSDEARRQAVAALSRCPLLPRTTALFIGRQPIGIAAIFLASSQAIDDEVLVAIAGIAGPAHTKAIARRDDLSPMVVDALVSLHNGAGMRPADSSSVNEPAPPAAMPPAAHRSGDEAGSDEAQSRRLQLLRDERLRHEIRSLARVVGHADADAGTILGGLSDVHKALLMRFARARDAGFFATTLADALSSSRALSKRILLDTSGRQLALTLVALDMPVDACRSVLIRFYPHLGQPAGNVTAAAEMLDAIDMAEAIARVRAWQRADAYTQGPAEREAPVHEPLMGPDRESDPRTAAKRTTAFSRPQQQRKTARHR